MAYAVGGLSGDAFGLRSPFMIGLVLMIFATLYSLLVLPYVKPVGVAKSEKSSTKGFVALMGPTRMLLPQKWRLPDGRVQKHWGVPLLALGVYLGVVRNDLSSKLIYGLMLETPARNRLYGHSDPDVLNQCFRIWPKRERFLDFVQLSHSRILPLSCLSSHYR